MFISSPEPCSARLQSAARSSAAGAELRCGATKTDRWDLALAPLAQQIANRFREHLPKLSYPIRSGAHFNSAFALTLAHEYASAVGDGERANLVRAHAL